MNKTILNVVKIVTALFMVLAGAMWVINAIKGDDAINANPNLANPIMILAYVTLILCALLAIVFGIGGLFSNPKAAKNALIGIVALAVVLGIGYALGSSEVTKKMLKLEVSGGTGRMVDMGLISFYILFIGAWIAIIFSSFAKALK